MIEDSEMLGLKCGDNICVSFTTANREEAVGMIDALMSCAVRVLAIAEFPLQQILDSKTGEPEYKIKTADAFTISDDDDDCNEKIKRKKV